MVFLYLKMFSWISKQIASNAASNAINKVERIISGKRIVMAVIGFTFFTSYEDMDDIIRIINSSEDLRVLIDGVTEIVKHET